MPFHDWENTPNFDPTRISVNSLQWVNDQGSLLSEAQEMAHNAHISQDFISSVIREEHLPTPLFWPSVTQVPFKWVNCIAISISGTSYFNHLITLSPSCKAFCPVYL